MLHFKPKTWAEIDISALKNNYDLLNKKAGGAKQICVVKADCYGHGTAIIPQLCEWGCDFFAVSALSEAYQIRQLAPDAEILILGYTSPDDVPVLIENNITQAMFSHEYACLISENVPNGERLKIHIKLDTGMNRIGYKPDEKELLLRDCGLEGIDIRGIFTHFAKADEPSLEHAQEQLDTFIEMKRYLNNNGIDTGLAHTSNSAAILRMQNSIFDAVRSGICLYGCEPSADVCTDGLIPVMTLKTIVAHVHTVKKGESVSYGGEFVADNDRTVATLAAGYGDGFLRACKHGKVGINGRLYNIVGRICMDQFMVDVTGGDVYPGDTAVLYGKGGMSVDEVARRAGTIGYELLTQVNKRVPRMYK